MKKFMLTSSPKSLFFVGTLSAEISPASPTGSYRPKSTCSLSRLISPSSAKLKCLVRRINPFISALATLSTIQIE